MVSTAARIGSINVLLSTQLGPGMAGLNAFAGAVDRTGASVSRSVAGIDRSIGGLNRSLGNINTRGMTSLTLGALRAGTALDQLRGFALAAGVAVGGLMPAAIAAGMIRTVDGAHRLSNQLRTVTSDSKDLKNTQDALFEVAQRTRSSFEATTTIYARTARATEHLGLSQQKLLRITETVQKALAVGGASTAEAQGAAIQLSQGIASNRFSGEEFRSVAENAPVLLRGMAESLGVNIGKLREMAHAGELTADVVTKAILDASRKIDEDFAKTTSTIEQAWVRVGNAVTKYAMDSQGASAASASIVTVLNALAAHIDTVADSLMLLGVAFASALGGRKGMAVIAGTAGFIKDLRTMRAETLANAEAAKKAANAEALAAATRARELRQNVISTSRGRKDELGEMRAAMLKSNADKAIAAEQQMAAAAQKSGEVRAAADAKAAAAKADATQKWSHFMAVARQEKKEAIDSARATLAAAEAQKAATATRLTGARAYYEMSKAAGVSQKTQIKAGKDLQSALQADLKATNGVVIAQTNLQAALDGTAKKSRTYLAAQKAVEVAKKQVVATSAAAAAAEMKHTEAVAAHAAAQRAAQAAIVSGNLTKEQEAALNKRAEMLERKVAAAKAQSAAATLAARDAARAATAATSQLAIAQQAASVKAMAAAAANRAWQASLAFVGGPLGAALLALGGIMYLQSRSAAQAEAAAAEYSEAIKKAGEESNGAAGGIRAASAELSKAALAAGDAARNVSLANAQATFEDSVARMRALASSMRGVIDTAVGFNSMTFSPVASEVDGLVTRFEKGEISAEELRAAIDKIAAANPDNSAVLARIQEIGDIADASRGRVDALIGTLEQLQRSAFSALEAAAGLTDAGVGKKSGRAVPALSDAEFAARTGWDEYFKFPKEKKPKKQAAPRKTADDRFDNMLQSLADRTEALRQEREALNLNYAEQLRREESLKLEQEALKQVREEARRKGEADWQNAQLTPEQVALIRERVNAHVEEAMALKYAKESQDAWKDAAASAGDMMRGLIDGTMDWKTALLQLIPVVLKLMNSLNIAGGGAGIFGGGVFQSFMGSLLGVSFHGGGTVGKTGNVVQFPTGAPFAGVFHGGGNFGGRRAKHDEVMALVQKHENIFTSDQTDKIIGALSASAVNMQERSSFAPVYNIDARGADVAAVARLEAGLAKVNREMGARIVEGVRKAQKSNVKLG